MSSIVDQQLIDAFDQRLRAQGVPWLAERPPGLTDEEIDRIAAPLGYALPEEVRRWYRWHNGSAGWDLVLSRVQTTLEEDVGDTVYFRDMDDNWRPGWLKVMNEKPYILFDCSSDPEAPVAVWHYDYEQGYPTRPVFDSIGEMLRFWMALIDEGQMFWDPDVTGTGVADWRVREPLPHEIARTLGGVPTD
jgi:hypothetical protein